MRNREEGFSYVEVMIAVVILMVGILGLMSAMATSVLQTKGQEQQLLAKHYAASAMESIMSVKETDPARLGWDAVGNVGSNIVNGVPRGIFLTDWQPVMTDPGADEVIGTADDAGTTVAGLQRRVTITDICDPDRPSPICNPPGTSKVRVRTVEVQVRYFVGGLARQESLTTVMTDYAVVEE
ncbi:MAG: prepilin-type N-terminal cleavage/methylation domain-containing protein [Acidobacteria bacterium]|nr:prepilin-type N-terminal cleavage/methylation domain-containing protein [Acidobacteriota bacterium]MCW5949082.1 prepilin-type N-terminal cleavage/methylation domain-containing protein [Pyrinomonadaceae bacterium]